MATLDAKAKIWQSYRAYAVLYFGNKLERRGDLIFYFSAHTGWGPNLGSKRRSVDSLQLCGLNRGGSVGGFAGKWNRKPGLLDLEKRLTAKIQDSGVRIQNTTGHCRGLGTLPCS
jgi:hypothetical protein